MPPASQRHHHSTRPPLVAALASFAGAFAGIAAVALLDRALLADTDLALVIGAFGATAVLLFAAPGSPFAQPWNVLVGHVISAFIGVAAYQLLGAGWLAAALAVGLAIFAMQMTRSIHPPGGASALIAVLAGPKVHALGWLYPLVPVTAGAVVLLAVALVANNIGRDRRWPVFWY